MKTPKEWFEEELSGEPLTQESVIEVLEMVQKESWNEAIDKAVKSAITKSFKLSKYNKYPRWKVVKNEEVDLFSYDFKTEVDKQSILKLKL